MMFGRGVILFRDGVPYKVMKKDTRIRLINWQTDAILWYHRKLRELSRWIFSRTLPPHWLSIRYRRLYIERQQLENDER